MNFKTIGYTLILSVLIFGGVFHLMDWSYNAGRDDGVGSCNKHVQFAMTDTRNKTVLEYQTKLENALQAKEIEYHNWDYAKTECIESNVVELCDCPVEPSTDDIVAYYEDMITERDNEIIKLRSNLTNYQCK